MSPFSEYKRSRVVRHVVAPFYRLMTVSGYVLPPCVRACRWLFTSREWTNFTYPLTDKNIAYLCSTLSVVTGVDDRTVYGFVRELLDDSEVQRHVTEATRRSDAATEADLPPRFCKRLSWYAVARATKPRLIIETGVDKGLGSVVLCAALLRNAAEGRPGAYIGTDINPAAGYLLSGRYATVGQIRVGDSLETLEKISGPVDLFINDSDHSAAYEYREYQTIASALSDRSILIGDNAHVTDCLLRFSRETGRAFLYWQEEPLDHWYPGAGMGISWQPLVAAANR